MTIIATAPPPSNAFIATLLHSQPFLCNVVVIVIASTIADIYNLRNDDFHFSST